MYKTITYKGELNGIKGIWCGQKPNDVIIEQEVMVYHADKGKVFVKDDKKYYTVVLQDGETILDYDEINDKIENIGENING